MPDQSVPRHAEIAGAGFAGLTAAAGLARRGWSVRVHEQAPDLRSGGFALALHANGIRVLESLDALDAATVGANLVARREVRDGQNRIGSRFDYARPPYRALRTRIQQALAQRATEAGAEIVTGSRAVGATANGTLLLDGGERREADLVVAADGVNSPVRDALGLVRRRRMLRDGAMRLLVEGAREAAGIDPDTSVEWCSGSRRIIFSPTGGPEVYIALSCLAADASGRAVPIDLVSWRRAFPAVPGLFERIHAAADWDQVRWVQFQVIALERWSRGRVAVVGDAAHAMTPNLGQGAMTAMVNALSLAAHVGDGEAIEDGLAAWERAERPLIEHTQRMSTVYGAITQWPRPLRAAAFWLTSRSSLLARQFTRAADHVPRGT